MPSSLPIRISRKAACLLAAASLIAVSAVLLRVSARADNPAPTDVVGAIDGDSISVSGPMSVEATHGQVRTNLRSGADVHVKSGQARIELVEGGQIAICGPAHFSVLKSGKLLTIALESGTLHAHIEGEPSLTVYTPQIQASPISIGNGPQDTLVGLDGAGVMCIHAKSGAVRIEQQLTGQSVIVPQSGDVSLANGQLESMSNTPTVRCACELQPIAKLPPPEVSQPATAEEAKKEVAEKKPAPAPTSAPVQGTGGHEPAATPPPQQPVYQVFMPPLQYDVNSVVQQDYDPNLVFLVRRVRVRPTLILQGRVEGDPVVAQNAPVPPLATTAKPKAASKPVEDSTWDRVRTFVKRLFSPSS